MTLLELGVKAWSGTSWLANLLKSLVSVSGSRAYNGPSSTSPAFPVVFDLVCAEWPHALGRASADGEREAWCR